MAKTKIMAFDIETAPDSYILKRKEKNFNPKKVVVKPYLIGLYYELQGEKKIFKYFETPQEFIQYLWDYINENHISIQLLAFNTTYDLSIVFPYFIKEMQGNKFIYDTKQKIVNGWFHYKKYRIIFNDVLRLWPNQKLKYVGEELNIKKGEIEYSKFNVEIKGNLIHYLDKNGKPQDTNLENELDYLKKDCEIVYKAYYEFFNRVRKTKDKLQQKQILPYMLKDITPKQRKYFLNKSLTIGMAGKKYMEMYLWHKYQKDWTMFQPEISQQEYNLSKLSYFGGFTSYNKDLLTYKTKPNEVIYYYDINSSYPYEMTKKLPYGLLLDEKPKNNYIEWLHITYEKIEYKKKYNFIKQNLLPLRLITKKLNSFMLHREFFNFVKTMCNFTNLKIVRKKYQKLTKTPILKEYVNGLMESKNDAKQNGDTSLQQGIKYLLNTPYGKMGQKPFEEDYILNEYNQIEKKDKDVNSIKYRMVNTASFIVQNARLHLLSVIKKIIDDGGKFLYCDTDSLTMVVDKNVDMNKYMEIDDYKLGAWDCEGEFNEFYNPKCSKKYLLLNTKTNKKKFAFSGFDKNLVVEANYDKRLFKYNVLLLNGKVDNWKNEKGNIVLWNTDGESSKRSGWEIKWKYDIITKKWYNYKKEE